MSQHRRTTRRPRPNQNGHERPRHRLPQWARGGLWYRDLVQEELDYASRVQSRVTAMVTALCMN